MEIAETHGNSLSKKAHRAREDIEAKVLEVIATTGNMAAAARYAGINRMTIAKWRDTRPDFAEKFNEALETSIDKLELVARQRAIEGVKEPIYYKGELIDHVYRPSDRLMELLLKAHRRDKYGDKQQIDLNASVTIEIAGFAAPQPGGEVIEGETIKQGGLSATPPPKVEPPRKPMGIDIADFSEIFSEE